MTRPLIMRAGAAIAAGFLFASALANYSFGVSLGRTSWEGQLYGFVGVLAVALNAIAPFFLAWSLTASRRTTATAIGLLWMVCLLYSTASALGFAAQNRETVALSREASQEAYADVRRELLDLEARRQSARAKDRAALDARIDDARSRLSKLRGHKHEVADAQSAFLASLSFGLFEARHVRQALVALFALMVELGATLTLFAALSHAPVVQSVDAQRQRWTPNTR